MVERRGAGRKEFTRSLDFKASAFESAAVFGKGKALDISAQGLGLLTDYRLEKGMVLRLVLPEYWAGDDPRFCGGCLDSPADRALQGRIEVHVMKMDAGNSRLSKD